MINRLIITSIMVLLVLLSCKQSNVPAPLPVPSPPPVVIPESPPVDTTEPTVEIISAPVEAEEGQEVTIQWIGSDDQTQAADLTYSYYLQNYDNEYSPFKQATVITYSDLTAGTYTFYVKSKDNAGNISSHPALIEITITAVIKDEEEVQPPITSQLTILPNSEVNHIAVGSYDNIIYALDSANGHIYKSEHGGFGWRDISSRITGAPTWPAFAIAPDNHNIMAVATDAGTEVWLSVDGGDNFFISGLSGKLGAGERIRCIAVSPTYGDNAHEVVIGTSTGNGKGRVLINVFGMFPGSWNDISTGAIGWQPPAASGGDVFAIEYSPSFTGDGAILAVVASGPNANTGDTYLYAGSRDPSANTCIWNQFSGYPVEICQAGQDTPGTPLTFADLALPSDYQGSSMAQRHIYACWTDDPPGGTPTGSQNDDVYRIDDSICYQLQAKPDTMCSLAHYGFYRQGKLLAGAISSKSISYPGSQVYFTANPQAAYPEWQHSQKPPSGPNAQVAWSPDGNIAYCGTGTLVGSPYDQSAFSRSTDKGLTWNQIGLIDT